MKAYFHHRIKKGKKSQGGTLIINKLHIDLKKWD